MASPNTDRKVAETAKSLEALKQTIAGSSAPVVAFDATSSRAASGRGTLFGGRTAPAA